MNRIVFCLLFILIVGCSKSSDPSSATNGCKVKTITLSQPSNVYFKTIVVTYNYDNAGNLFSVVFDDPANPPLRTVSITLDANKNIIQMDYDGSVSTAPGTYYLPNYTKAVITYNSAGKIIEVDATGWLYSFPYLKTIYTYNGSQQLVQVIDKFYNTAAGNTYTDYTTILYRYLNNSSNPSEVANCSSPCTSPDFVSLSYNTDTAPNPIGLFNFILEGGRAEGLRGILSQAFFMTKNLTYGGTASYIIDNHNLITKMSISLSPDSDPYLVYDLTYQCN